MVKKIINVPGVNAPPATPAPPQQPQGNRGAGSSGRQNIFPPSIYATPPQAMNGGALIKNLKSSTDAVRDDIGRIFCLGGNEVPGQTNVLLSHGGLVIPAAIAGIQFPFAVSVPTVGGTSFVLTQISNNLADSPIVTMQFTLNNGAILVTDEIYLLTSDLVLQTALTPPAVTAASVIRYPNCAGLIYRLNFDGIIFRNYNFLPTPPIRGRYTTGKASLIPVGGWSGQ
jgi:hypothetical protein